MAGQNGLTHVKSEVTYRNGKEVSRVIVQETVQTKPVTQLVIRGVDRTIMEQPADPEPAEQAAPAASSGTASGSSSSGSSSSGGSRYDGSAETSGNVIMTSSGESYTYVDVMTCSATAYTCEAMSATPIPARWPAWAHRGRPDRHPARHEDVCRFKRRPVCLWLLRGRGHRRRHQGQ